MSEELRSVLIGTLGLDVAAALAAVLTVSRGALVRDPARVRRTVQLALLVLACQAAHFAEELATGFHLRFPELLGLAPWSTTFFVPFNLFWLALWGASAAGLARYRRWALFPLWFLAIAGAANGLMHPLFSALVGGYFPGLVTSPLVGIGGVWLLRRLHRVTGPARETAGRGGI